MVDSDIARAGVGQLTTFNQLGFPGVADKPDGWYLPNNRGKVAVVLETKATRISLGQTQVDEVLKNVRIAETQYEKVVGILYNGDDIRIFKGAKEIKTPTKLQALVIIKRLSTGARLDEQLSPQDSGLFAPCRIIPERARKIILTICSNGLDNLQLVIHFV